MRTTWIAAAALGLLCGPAVAAGLEGDWLVAEGTSVIRIGPCGNALCGKIAWTPASAAVQSKPEPGKQEQSMVGTTILIGMTPAGDNRWDGEIFNPQDGKTYTGHLTLRKPDVLEVQGCLLVFCGGESWTRTSSEPVTGAAVARSHAAVSVPGHPVNAALAHPK